MASVTSDYIRALSGTVKAIYSDAYTAKNGLWNRLATVLDSSQASEEYSWISEIPFMREFVDERQVQALQDYGFTIRNKTWEATIGIRREVIEDDQTGQIKMRVLTLADSVNAHYDKLLFDLINSNPLAYDGQAFYSVAHANLVTTAFSAEALQDAIGTMKGRSLPNGEPMDVAPSVLLVPPALEWDARRVLNSAYWPDPTGGGGSGEMAANPLQGLLELVVSNRLLTATEWHVFDATHTVKPWIIQQRIAPEFAALDDSASNEAAFLRDEYLYGVRSRDNAGPGLWQYGYKSTGAG